MELEHGIISSKLKPFENYCKCIKLVNIIVILLRISNLIQT